MSPEQVRHRRSRSRQQREVTLELGITCIRTPGDNTSLPQPRGRWSGSPSCAGAHPWAGGWGPERLCGQSRAVPWAVQLAGQLGCTMDCATDCATCTQDRWAGIPQHGVKIQPVFVPQLCPAEFRAWTELVPLGLSSDTRREWAQPVVPRHPTRGACSTKTPPSQC